MSTKEINLFLELVQIDSPSGEEQEMRQFLRSKLDKMGFACQEDKTGNLLAKAKNMNPHLLLCAHMDTVSPGRNIRPEIVNGVIKSDGTTILGADNKAGIFAIIEAVNKYKRIKCKLPPIEILFSVKEETGGGVEFFPFSWVEAKRGLTFDHAAPLGTLTLAAPYIYNFRISFLGKSAHASRPEEGKNAITAAAQFISSLKVGSMDDHTTTVNIGKIIGGNGINIIPDLVLVEGEVRSTDKAKFEVHLKQVESLALSIADKHGVKIQFKLDGYCPGYMYDKEDEFVNKMREIIESAGMKVKYESSTGVSDVNSLIGAGIKSVCISDGVKSPHTNNESVSINNLLGLRDLAYRIIEEF